MASIKKISNKCWQDMEIRDPGALLVGMSIGTATIKNSMEVPQKIKIEISQDSTTEYLPKENESTNSKRYMYLYVYCSIYNNQNMEAT